MVWIELLFHLLFVYVSAGLGALVVILIQSAFDMMKKKLAVRSTKQLKQKIYKAEDAILPSQLKNLLDQRRKTKWWIFVVWIIVSSLIYFFVFYQGLFRLWYHW
ncbi:MAG: hypothetical protein ACYS6W_07525 [Planctomycetota bacterium]|jgi:hypothetical protein